MTNANEGAKKEKRGPGQPTKYLPEHCERVQELGKEGCSLAEMALDLDIAWSTLQLWAKTHPEFSAAMDRARKLALGWWEKQGRKGIWAGKEFNAQAYRLQVMNRFPDTWRDTREIQLKGSLADLDMSKLPQACVVRIAAGENPLQVLAEFADWALNPPAEQKALPPAGDSPGGDGEVGEG